MNNVARNLLTYIGHCLKEDGNRFSYAKVLEAFDQAHIKTEITTLRKEFSILKKNNYFDFKTYYGKPYPILSRKGKLEIKTELPFKKYDWDGEWRLIILDLPERMRAKRLIFTQELLNIGFGKFARGGYISPHPFFMSIRDLAEKLHIKNYLLFLKVSKIDDEKAKIYQAWKIKDINDKYEKYIKNAEMQSFYKRRYWALFAKRLEREFAEIYAADPHLPKDFLPPNWKGEEAYHIFKATSNSY